MTKDEAVSIIAPAALESEQQSGLPAEITAAQCALESGWLKHSPGNNCFGIKQSGGEPGQLLTTKEWFTEVERDRWVASKPGRMIVEQLSAEPNGRGRLEYRVKDWFRAYDSLTDCFKDHARLITNGKPYRKPWGEFIVHRSWKKLLSGIAPVYATAPTYETSILAILEGELADAIQAARKATQ